MALIRCKECDAQVSKSAKVCPSCGISMPGIQTWVLYVGNFIKAIFLIIIALMLYVLYTREDPPPHPPEIIQEPARPVARQTDDFERIFDLTLPVYSTKHTILCPYDLYEDPGINPSMLVNIFIDTPKFNEQANASGCTRVRPGMRLYAQRLSHGMVAIATQDHGNRYPYIAAEFSLEGSRLLR